MRHAYSLEVGDDAVHYEALYSYPLRKARLLFAREGSDLHFRRGLGSLAGTRELLLNHLNRDEAWLTEKGDDGATRSTALAEYGGERVRRSVNLEKAYLQGRFGAVPELDQFVLRRALGLTPDA